MKSVHLSDGEFITAIKTMPLISIDLLVSNGNGHVLVGLRKMKPAQGYWFVPGGRIRKNETLDDAFIRIVQVEIGTTLHRSQARLLGVYEHFYDDNVFDTRDDSLVGTHYVVLGYGLSLPDGFEPSLPHHQHNAYRWLTPAEILVEEDVHANTKAYFA
jgi:colanic acid biosynthesis protein WcaH